MHKSGEGESHLEKLPNRKARHEYFVEESFEAGIELFGTEVKSLRAGSCNLKDSWCDIKDGELWIKQMHIAPYEHGNIFNRDAYRERRLQIMKLMGQTAQQGYTLIPLSIYFKGSRVKVQLGLCKGKQLHDKRADMAKRDAKRDIERALRDRQRGSFLL